MDAVDPGFHSGRVHVCDGGLPQPHASPFTPHRLLPTVDHPGRPDPHLRTPTTHSAISTQDDRDIHSRKHNVSRTLPQEPAEVRPPTQTCPQQAPSYPHMYRSLYTPPVDNCPTMRKADHSFEDGRDVASQPSRGSVPGYRRQSSLTTGARLPHTAHRRDLFPESAADTYPALTRKRVDRPEGRSGVQAPPPDERIQHRFRQGSTDAR
jgi:hypothetical protein